MGSSGSAFLQPDYFAIGKLPPDPLHGSETEIPQPERTKENLQGEHDQDIRLPEFSELIVPTPFINTIRTSTGSSSILLHTPFTVFIQVTG